MTLNDFAQVMNPFRPFRIVMTNGQAYDVWHREAFLLTPTYVTVGLLPGPTVGAFERTIILDLFHVVSLEPLARPASAKGNGEAGQT
jgi:hypothetical protein